MSGKQALFVNEGFTTRIVDVSEKESEALLSFFVCPYHQTGVSGALALATK